jgi:hypothetical protein
MSVEAGIFTLAVSSGKKTMNLRPVEAIEGGMATIRYKMGHLGIVAVFEWYGDVRNYPTLALRQQRHYLVRVEAAGV